MPARAPSRSERSATAASDPLHLNGSGRFFGQTPAQRFGTHGLGMSMPWDRRNAAHSEQ